MKYQIQEVRDASTWNSFVLRHNHWSFFQSWEWGQIQKKLRHHVWCWGIYFEHTLVGAAQGVLVEARRGTFLHLRHGPVINKNHFFSKAAWSALIEHIIPIALSHQAWFIRLNPMVVPSGQVDKLFSYFKLRSAPIHAMDAETCWVLPLDESESELLSHMRKTTRYLIRHAEKNGVIVKTSNDLPSFLSLYARTASRQKFVTHKGIEEEYTILKRKNMLELVTAYHHNTLISAALILYWGKEAIYHHSASIPTKTGANHLLQWELIKRAKARKMTYYNFWGIAPTNHPRHPWQNITLFKTGFGGHAMHFTHAHDLPLSPWYYLTYMVETIRKIKRGY